MEQERANIIISGADNVFSFTVLGECVGAGHAEMNHMCKKKHVGAGVVKLAAIVTLNRLNNAAELGGRKSKEVSHRREYVKLKSQMIHHK